MFMVFIEGNTLILGRKTSFLLHDIFFLEGAVDEMSKYVSGTIDDHFYN